MITVTEHALQTIGLPSNSALGAVQAVREHVYDGTEIRAGKAIELVNKLLGTNVVLADIASFAKSELAGDAALMIAQACAETIVRNVGQPVDEAEVLAKAKARVAKLMSAPQHQWMFAKPEPTSYGGPVTQVAVADGIETKVAVKADGSIKKGGKEVLAAELYKKYVAELNGAEYNNQAFIAILIKQLGMTKSGATTYNYNMKKKFGGQIESKKK